jgi:hypothetical protein
MVDGYRAGPAAASNYVWTKVRYQSENNDDE